MGTSLKLTLTTGFAASILLAAGCQQGGPIRISKHDYIDKCKGAWAGQMIGVCYGAPYEFKVCAQTLDDPLKPWTPERIAGAIGQDDCYVEMTFLQALDKHGPDITFEQAGRAFADTTYGLAHANLFGRDNVRRGIMPPMSGHPKYNRHADDIDFQIEADLIGIICPGLPHESNRLANVFGHIMNYGDGVYGGMFVAGMYSAAYFEGKDVEAVVRAGLACIPEASQYHRCISDVIQWHAEKPDDWRTTWEKIEKKWQDNVDCTPAHGFNIDAKLNGAYIVVGLLYGKGDLARTMEIATRCGQDADCNPSNAVGVLGCMKGFDALGEEYTGGIADIENKNFSNTEYSFRTLIPACQRTTEAVILRAGGQVTDDAYLIPVQRPTPPETLEQWTNQEEIVNVAISQWDLERWNPAWKIGACGMHLSPGLLPGRSGRRNVLMLHPLSRTEPGFIFADLPVPDSDDPRLAIDVTSHEMGDFLLKVVVDGDVALEKLIDGKGKWSTQTVGLKSHAGRTTNVRIEVHPNDWSFEAAYFSTVEIK